MQQILCSKVQRTENRQCYSAFCTLYMSVSVSVSVIVSVIVSVSASASASVSADIYSVYMLRTYP